MHPLYRRGDDAEALLDQALALGEKLPEPALGLWRITAVQALQTVAWAQARAADAAACARMARRLQTLDNALPAQAALAAAMARAGDFAGALKTAAAIPKNDPRDSAYGEIALAQARAGKPDDALKTAAAIAAPADRLSAVGIVVAQKLKAGDADGALRLVVDAPFVAPWAKGLEIKPIQAARAIVQLLRDAQAVGIYAQGFEAIHAATIGFLDQLHEDYHTGFLMGILARGNPEDAASLRAHWLDPIAAAPDPTISSLVLGMLWAQDTEGARTAAARARNKDDRAGALGLLVVEHARAGDTAAALARAAKIEIRPVRAVVLAAGALHCAQKGDKGGAKALLDRAMPEIAVTKDPESRFTGLAAAARVRQTLGDAAGARALLPEIVSWARRQHPQRSADHFFADLADLQIELGDLPGALATARHPAAKGYTEGNILLTVAKATAQAGDRAGADRLFAERTNSDFAEKRVRFPDRTIEAFRAQTVSGGEDDARRRSAMLTNPADRAAALLGIGLGLLDHKYPPIQDSALNGAREWVFRIYR